MRKHHKRLVHHLIKHLILMLTIGFILGVFILILGNFYFEKFNPPIGINFGVSFSPSQAAYLGLDWQKTYIQILDELKVKRIRLSVPWDLTEPTPEKFDFSKGDFMVKEAQKRQVQVLLVIGYKQPRWPECIAPAWALDLPLPKRQQAILSYLKAAAAHYQKDSNIWGFQVENEPLLKFGDNCDEPDRSFLIQEVNLVRSLKTGKKIVVTDSGELRAWRTPMRVSDIFGTTLYRSAYDKFLGYFYWPIPPAFYHFKSDGARVVFAPNNQKTIISELQTEPWSIRSLAEVPLDKQLQLLSLNQFKDNIDYGKKTGFDEIYLWGVEWWYYMKQKGHPEYVDYAKTLFR